MADDSNFRVKNTLVVNGAFVANSTVVNAAALSATTIAAGNVSINATVVAVGANITTNTTTIALGNSSVYTNTVAGQITISGTTINSTFYQATSFNANNLGGNGPTYYTNATNINSGTLPMAQLGANVVNTSAAFTITGARTHSAAIAVNANVTVNAGSVSVNNGNIVLGANAALVANGSSGTSGQILISSGTSAYWGTTTTAVRQTFTATANQTTFAITGGYTPNLVDVYYNGVKLINGTEVQVNSGNNVVLVGGALAGAIVDVVGFFTGIVSTPNNAVAKTGDTMSGALNLPTNGLVVGTTQLVAVGNNIGIGTSTPASRLDVNGVITQNGLPILPPGIIMEYGGNTAPTGWLLCDGAAVSRATFAALFAVVGTAYGSGDGANTFNVPDRRGRFGIGANGTYAVGASGGSLTTAGTTLTSNQIPSHTHTGTTSTNGDHFHTTDIAVTSAPSATSQSYYGPGSPFGNYSWQSSTAGSHNHTFTTAATGGGQAHDHTYLPPYLASNYIIKT